MPRALMFIDRGAGPRAPCRDDAERRPGAFETAAPCPLPLRVSKTNTLALSINLSTHLIRLAHFTPSRSASERAFASNREIHAFSRLSAELHDAVRHHDWHSVPRSRIVSVDTCAQYSRMPKLETMNGTRI
jgi:hypothetical protein